MQEPAPSTVGLCLGGCGGLPTDARADPRLEGAYRGKVNLALPPEKGTQAGEMWAACAADRRRLYRFLTPLYDWLSDHEAVGPPSMQPREPDPSEHDAVFRSGRWAPALADDWLSTTRGGVRLTVVGPTPDGVHLGRAAWIVECAYVEMGMRLEQQPFRPGSEAEARRERQRFHAVLGHVDDRLVGVAVLSCQTEDVYRARWLGASRCACLEAHLISAQGWTTLGLIWVHPTYRSDQVAYRNLHLGTKLLKYAAEVTPAGSVGNLAFAAPFSEAGRTLLGAALPTRAPVSLYLDRHRRPRFDPCTHRRHPAGI
jgi:GNAT superfamily N-acetyltransferase